MKRERAEKVTVPLYLPASKILLVLAHAPQARDALLCAESGKS